MLNLPVVASLSVNTTSCALGNPVIFKRNRDSVGVREGRGKEAWGESGREKEKGGREGVRFEEVKEE